MVRRVVFVASDVFVRRLMPSLSTFVQMRLDFRIVDIHRPPRELVQRVRELNPTGIITESLPQLTQAILRLGIPTVVADTDLVHRGTASIDVDDRAVGAEAARFFRNAGYAHFACVHNGMPYSAQRLEGFRAALDGRRPLTFRQAERRARYYMESWNEPTDRLHAWLLRLPRPIGVFAVHDPLARLVVDAASEAGLHVPEDAAIVGANNDEFVCSLSYPPLSSVEIAWNRIGTLAGKWVQALIDGRRAPTRPILVKPGPVHVRQSTAIAAVDDPGVRRVVRHLRSHLREPLTIGGACKALRLSRRAIERKFAEHLRTSPWDSLCRMRVEAAKSLLVRTSQPMSAIAEDCGFGNAERFSVVFRRHAGMSPSAFRKTAAGGA